LRTQTLVTPQRQEQLEVHPAPVEFVIRLVVLQEFVKLPILVGTLFSRLGKVAMMGIRQAAMIAHLAV
jgi:hypothetical protein